MQEKASDLNYNGCKNLACAIVVDGIEVYTRCANAFANGEQDPHEQFIRMCEMWLFVCSKRFEKYDDALPVTREQVLTHLRKIKDLDEMAREIEEREKTEHTCRTCKYAGFNTGKALAYMKCHYLQVQARKKGAKQRECATISTAKICTDKKDYWQANTKWRKYYEQYKRQRNIADFGD